MSDNLGQDLLTGISEAIVPLKEVNSAPSATALFAKLGYALPGVQTFTALPLTIISKVGDVGQGIIALVDAEGDTAKMNAFLDLALKVKDVAVAIHDLVNTMQSSGSAPVDFFTHAPVDQIPRRLLDYLISVYVETKHSGSYGILLLLGFFDEQKLPANAAIFQPECTLRKVCWERIPKYFSEPRALAEEIYQWETNFNSNLFLERLERILQGFMLPGGIYTQNADLRSRLGNTDANTKEIRMPLLQAGNTPELFSQFGIIVSPVGAAPPELKGLAILPYFVGVSQLAFSLNEKYEITLTTAASIDDGVGLVLRPPFQLGVIDKIFTTPGEVGNFEIRLALKKKSTADGEIILFGEAGGSRLSIKGVKMEVFALKRQAVTDFGFEVGVQEAKIVIGGGNGDGFIQNLLKNVNINVVFELGIGYSAKGGVYFKGSGGLEIELPTHLSIGPVEIQGATIGIRPSAGKIPISFGTSIKGELGPITAVVQNMGITTEISFPDSGGNMGPLDIQLKFKPPTGVGLNIDASIVKGGGFILFDPDKGQYAGALELSIQNTIQVAAICVINTILPDGSKGFSLLIIISATFSPGISLTMGFFLSGLGGMLGIHRTINVDAMRDGVRNGAIDNIMFPEDVVNNITTIIQQITTIFPPKRDQFIIGLMARITWGIPSLVTIDFGIAVEFASPTRIAILGVVKIVLPTEEAAILQLQVNFVGIIDFEEGMLSFDASLFNSRILTFTLEGDMALRLGWGRTKGFLLSIGGFHPAFRPPDNLHVPSLKRLTLNILSGNPRLVVSCYFAVTSNTVQFGARLDLLFQVSEFKVVGYLYFDVLFQFSPFHFIANIGAGLEVKMGSTTLLSITLDFELSGPTPWHAKGTASFSILFFTIKVRFEKEWGESSSIEVETFPVLPKALEALSLPGNWTAEIPVNRTQLVTLADIKKQDGKLVLQPFGSFKVSQTIVPLAQILEKFGTGKPADIQKLDITEVKVGSITVGREYAKESFAPALFKNMEDKDKLAAASFEPMSSGIRVSETNELVVPSRANRKVEYEVKVSDFDPTPETVPVVIESSLFKRMILGGEIGRSTLSRQYADRRKRRTDAAVDVLDESFVVVNKATMQPVSTPAFSKGTYSEASDMMSELYAKNPALRGKVSVVPAYHLEMA